MILYDYVANVMVCVDPTLIMSAPEITAFVLFGLGLTAQMAFQTLSRLNYDSLTSQPRDRAMEEIEEVADDELMKGIEDKLEVLCDKAGVPLTHGPYNITDLMFHSGDNFDAIRLSYHDLLSHGLMSGTFSYAMDILAVMQAQGLAV